MKLHKLFVQKNINLCVLIIGILQFILSYIFISSGEDMFVFWTFHGFSYLIIWEDSCIMRCFISLCPDFADQWPWMNVHGMEMGPRWTDFFYSLRSIINVADLVKLWGSNIILPNFVMVHYPRSIKSILFIFQILWLSLQWACSGDWISCCHSYYMWIALCIK
jgi:hypothetical protein